jgi:hypothetical protein
MGIAFGQANGSGLARRQQISVLRIKQKCQITLPRRFQ